MNSEHYITFVKAHEYFKNNKDGVEKFNAQGTGEKTADMFNRNITQGIEKCKVFEIDDKVKKLLCLTKTPNKNDEIKLPFSHLFLDVNFKKDELEELGIEINSEEIKGILFQEGVLIHEETRKQVGRDLNITMMTRRADGIYFDTFNKNPNYTDEEKDYEKFTIKENPTTDKKCREFVHKFVLNFLNFINNPEVSYIEHKRSENNKMLRRKRNQVVINSTSTIKVTGQLKIYLDEIDTSGATWKYGYRFWVRGHFRELTSDRYNQQKRIWILPYIKGKGVLVEKTYKVAGDEE